MKKWFTSDLHFGHRNVIQYCKRPYKDIKEMDAAIIEQWNSQVAPDDLVYFLGDFGINKKKVFDKDLVGSLNGHKSIRLGNHDFGFTRLFTDRNVQSIKKQYVEAGWEYVDTVNTVTLKNGQEVVLSHLPPDNEYDSRYKEFKLSNCPKTIYLHGHLHGKYKKYGNMIDVAYDSELRLISEDEVIAMIEDKRDFIPTRLTEHYKTDPAILLRPYEKEVKQKNLRKVETEDLVLYNYTDHCTYEKNWNDITRASRGIIFEKATAKLVALPFPKFFNVNEMEETRLENLPNEEFTVTDKMDGSLGIIYYYNGAWHVATRGSFSSEQAQKAKQILDAKYDMSQIKKDHTLLVEIIYPENKIVCNYGKEEKLVLLSASNRERKMECHSGDVQAIAELSGMPLVKTFNHSIEEMVARQKILPKDQEGFVVRFKSGMRVKIKGEEYMRIHRMISRMSPLAFWETMRHGKCDVEYLKELPEEYRSEAEALIQKLEFLYQKEMNILKVEVDRAIMNIGFGNIKDESYRKKLGIYCQQNKCNHLFPFFLENEAAVDRNIMKKIRPKGNSI